MEEENKTNPFDQFDTAAGNPFDMFDVTDEEEQTAETAQAGGEVPQQEPATLTEAQQGISDYADQLVSQVGSYERADLEAAGYGAEDIDAYQSYVEQKQAESALPLDTGEVAQSGGYPTDMYRNMPFEQAADYYYNIVLQDENVTEPPLGVGYAIYTDPQTGEQQYIAPPSPKMFSDGAKTGAWDLAAIGLANALGNAIELGGAGLEYVGVEGATEAADKLIPQANTGQSAMDALIVEGFPMLVAGGGAGNTVYQTLKAAPTAIRTVASLVAGELANATVSGNDAGTVLIGDNAMIPMLSGVDLEDGNAQDVIEARMNILLDGMLASGIVAGGVQGAVTIGKFGYNMTAKPILDVLSSSDAPMQESVIQDIYDQLLRLDGEDYTNPQVAFEVRDRIAQIVEENKTVILPMLDNVDEDFRITLDTMTALERGLQDGGDNNLTAIIQGIRNQAVQSNQPLTSAAVRAPMEQLDKQTDALLRTTGGETATDQTATMAASADALAAQGRQEVLTAAGAAEDATAAYTRGASELVADIANDMELSDEITRLAGAVGTEIDTTKTAARSQIISQVEQAYTTLTRQKNDLYAAIRGGEVDTEGLISILDDLPTEMVTQATQNVRNSSPVRGLLQVVRRQDVEDVTELGETFMRAETDEERLVRVQQYLDKNGMDFGFFYRNIRPEVSQLAEDMFQTSPTAGRNLRGIVNFIDGDMVAYVAREGDEELADAAEEALSFYKDTYAPLFRDGRLSDYSRLYDTTVGRTGSIAEDAQDLVDVPRFNEVNYQSGTRSIVDETLQGGDPALVGQFKRLLSMSEAGADPSPLASYMVADSISNAYDVLRASGGTDAQLGGFVSSLRQYSEALNANFPERAAELNGFVRAIEAAQGNREQLKQVMENAQETVRATLQDVQQSELRFFYRREFAGSDNPLLKDLATTSNPQASFRALMLSEQPDRIAAMEAIMDRVRAVTDPTEQKVLRDGIETAYLRIFRDQTISPRTELGNMRAILPSRITRSQEEMNSLYRMGEVIYADRPEVMEAVKGVSDIAAGVARSRNAVPVSSMSATAFNQAAMTATNRLIYMTVGPLNRMGTRIRSFVSTLVQNADATARANSVRDNILANPDLFVELSRKYNRQPNDQVLQNMLIRFVFEGGIRVTNPDTNTAPEDNYPVPLGFQNEEAPEPSFLFP